MELGKHAADFVSSTFIRPVKLEFEKVWAERPRCVPPLLLAGCAASADQCPAQRNPRASCPRAPAPGKRCSHDVRCAGVLPLPAHEQEAVRGPPVDQPRKVRQDGHQGEPGLCFWGTGGGISASPPGPPRLTPSHGICNVHARVHVVPLQGIETVRRDNCLLVRNVVTTCLEKILIERNEQAAVQYVKVG